MAQTSEDTRMGWLKDADRQIIPIKKIKIETGRGRKTFTRIQELADSVRRHGLMNPLVVNDNGDDTYTLIAGERRYRACVLAGVVDVPVTLGQDLTELQQKILELEENVGREDLTALEEAELMRQIDEQRRIEDPNWTQTQTAELVGQSKGHMSLQLKVAKAVKDNPDLKKEVKGLDVRTAAKIIDRNKQVQKADRLKEQGAINIKEDFRHGSCLDHMPSIPDASIDLVITDPPYGADEYNQLKDGGYSPGAKLMSETHNMTLEAVMQLMSELVPHLSRVMKPSAHMYMFVPQQYALAFVQVVEEHGEFQFQYPPLIWDRGRTTQPAYGYNYQNRTEQILFFHRKPRERRLAKPMVNVFNVPEPTRVDRAFHTMKPVDLLKTFMKQSSDAGDTVLDPFAGSCSTALAARDLGRGSIGFEIDENTYKRALLHLAGKLKEEEPADDIPI